MEDFWRKIKTVPKDGSIVLLGQHKALDYVGGHRKIGYITDLQLALWNGTEWVDSFYRDKSVRSEEFSHWANIPCPPKTNNSRVVRFADS